MHTVLGMHVWYPHISGCGSLASCTSHNEMACAKAAILLGCFNLETILSKSW